MKKLDIKNIDSLNELSTEELNTIEGGNWIYDAFYAFAVGCVNDGNHNGSTGALKTGGAFMY